MTDWVGVSQQTQTPNYLGGKQTKNGYQSNLLNGIMSVGGNLIGGQVGAGVGGAMGAAVPGLDFTGIPEVVGAGAGRVAGGGAGAAVGNSGADLIRGLLGDKTVSPQQTLQNAPDQFAQGAASEAIGVPIAKGLGFAAHPIAPFIGKVNSILGKSSKDINIGEVGGLLDHFKTEVLPTFQRKGLGVEANDAYNNLATRVVNMITAMKPHIPAEAGVPTGGDVTKLTLPVAQANEMKRNLYQLASDSYGYIAKPEQEAIKQFARLTKNAVEVAEPGVKLPNAIASSLYQVPNFLKALESVIPGQGSKALNMVGGIPTKIIQKTVPQGGGYLNQLIPGLIQGGAQLNNQ